MGINQQIDRQGPNELITLSKSSNNHSNNKMKEDSISSQNSETWTRHLDFMLSCVGYAVGFGACWRFPYICMKNGGGAFLIPYFIFLLLVGLPLFFLELSLGQMTGLGPVAVWEISPLFKGIGWSMIILSFIASITSSMIISWVFLFLYHSFSTSLPWVTCSNPWNTPSCIARNSSIILNTTTNITSANNNISVIFNNDNLNEKMTPAEEFWHYKVLNISNGLDDLGSLEYQLVFCLLITSISVFLCLFRGIKFSGKVVYLTATLPYILLTILLVRGVMLPGATKGIIFYLYPNFEKLTDLHVWGEACLQIFYSLGPTWGGLISMSSHNNRNNNSFNDSVIISLSCVFTSIYSGFICFSIIGSMAHSSGMHVQQVVIPGPGLVFAVYPEALGQMPLSQFWSVSFFLMLLTLGMDSLFGMIETCTKGLADQFPAIFGKRKSLVTFFICLIIFICALPLATRGGMYIFQLIDWYMALYTCIIIGFLESIIISHLIGTSKFWFEIENMAGKKMCSHWWRASWGYVTPFILLLLIGYNILLPKILKYGNYGYPAWAQWVGLFISLISVLPIPIFSFYLFFSSSLHFKERLQYLVRPKKFNLLSREQNEVLEDKF